MTMLRLVAFSEFIGCYDQEFIIYIKQFTCLMHLASINALALLVNTRKVLIKHKEIL